MKALALALLVLAGGQARAVQADVGDAAQVRRMFDSIDAAFGGIDVIVNNAGIMPVGAVGDTDDAMFTKLIDVNPTPAGSTARPCASTAESSDPHRPRGSAHAPAAVTRRPGACVSTATLRCASPAARRCAGAGGRD